MISLRDEERIGSISIEWTDRKGELQGNHDGILVHLTQIPFTGDRSHPAL